MTKNILLTLIENEHPVSSQQLINQMLDYVISEGTKQKNARLEETKQKLVFEKLKYLCPSRFRFDRYTSLLEFNISENNLSVERLNYFIHKMNDLLFLKWNKVDTKTDHQVVASSLLDRVKGKNIYETKCFPASNYFIWTNIHENEIIIINTEDLKFIQINWSSEFDKNCSTGTLSLYRLPKNLDIHLLIEFLQFKKGIKKKLKQFSEDELEKILNKSGKYKFEEFVQILKEVERMDSLNLICKWYPNHHIRFYLKERNNKYKTKFLDPVLKEDLEISNSLTKAYLDIITQKDRIISSLKKRHEIKSRVLLCNSNLTKLVTETINNPRNWKYQINLKGFFLYLFIESLKITNLEEKKNKGRRREEKNPSYHRHNRTNKITQKIKGIKENIEELISTETVKEMCPFLLYGDEFGKKGLNVVEILLDIAREVIPQLDYYDKGIFKLNSKGLVYSDDDQLFTNSAINYEKEHDSYLLWKICEKYYYEVEKFFLLQDIDNPYSFMIFNRLNEKVRSGRKHIKENTRGDSDEESIVNFNYQNILEYRNIYEKLLDYRMQMCTILSNITNFEKESLINIYSRAYLNYQEKNFPNLNTFLHPEDFKKML